MTYDFDELIPRKGTNSVKWECGINDETQSDSCIPMWVADMDFACAPEIIRAIKEKANQRIFGYSMTDKSYYEKVCAFYKRRHNADVSPEDIIFTEGVVPALSYCIAALCQEGDKVIVQPPVYYPFYSVVTNNKCEIVRNNLILNSNGSYSIDFEDLKKKARGAKVMILCSPHNPVGRVWTQEELIRVYNICSDNDVILLCDEIHNDLIRKDKKHVSALELFPNAENLVVCTAPTKSFNMAGLGASHMFCKNEKIRNKIKEKVGNRTPNIFTAEAVMAAYTECDQWLDEVNSYIDSNFKRFYELCARYFPLAVPTKTEGTYLAWLDVRNYVGENTKELETFLYEKADVYIESGDAFEGKGWLRVNLACPVSLIEKAFRRAVDAVKESLNPEEAFKAAKEDPEKLDDFINEFSIYGDILLTEMSSSVIVPYKIRLSRNSWIREHFEAYDNYEDIRKLYKTRLNCEIVDATLEYIKK